MRALLAAVQRHKGASAAKMAQVAGLLKELEAPYALTAA